MQFVDVAVPGGPARAYEVVIGIELPHAVADDLMHWRPAPRWAVVTDTNVAPLYGEPLVAALREMGAAADCLAFPAGEQAKTRATVGDLQDTLIEHGHGRDSVLLAVGGGVVGDVGGFVAATLFRGIAYVQVPTTLLAMVDSSVGGKTGVDTPAGKNLVGAFLQPQRVLADLGALATLPRAELAAGLAEVIKYGVILDAVFFEELDAELLDAALACEPEALARIVSRCCDLKADVVAVDETESGYRSILNFGHTVAHALEASSGFGLRHGEAVATGMVVEARLAHRKLGSPAALADRIAGLCARAGLPTEIPADLDRGALLRAAFHDKKVRGGTLHCALPSTLGVMADHHGRHTVPIEPADLQAVLER